MLSWILPLVGPQKLCGQVLHERPCLDFFLHCLLTFSCNLVMQASNFAVLWLGFFSPPHNNKLNILERCYDHILKFIGNKCTGVCGFENAVRKTVIKTEKWIKDKHSSQMNYCLNSWERQEWLLIWFKVCLEKSFFSLKNKTLTILQVWINPTIHYPLH